MKIAKLLSLLGLAAMTIILVYAFSSGNFSSEGSKLISMPWGIVSLVDLYVGFSLFSGWIVYREKNGWSAFIWVILMMCMGFWAGSLYTFLALQTSNGDWNRFWLGKHYKSLA